MHQDWKKGRREFKGDGLCCGLVRSHERPKRNELAMPNVTPKPGVARNGAIAGKGGDDVAAASTTSQRRPV